VLCKLTSFRDSFTKEAALVVSQSSDDVYSSLVDKYLLEKVKSSRYKLHEIIRQFAIHKSVQQNLQNDASQSHADYYLAMLSSIGETNPFIYTEDVLSMIEVDLPNFIFAWNFMIDQGQYERVDLCIEPLFQYFNIQSRFQEGINLFQPAMEAVKKPKPSAPYQPILANRIGSLAHRLRRNDLALKMFLLGLQSSEETYNPKEKGLSLIGLGSYYLRAKDFELALRFAQQGLTIFIEISDLGHQASAYELLSLIYNRKANFKPAKEMLSKSIMITRQINDRRGLISSLNQMGDLECNEGNFEKAENYFLESLALSRTFKDRFNQAILLNNLASIYHPQKDYDREESVLVESLNICREIGDRDGEAIALNNLAELAVVRGDHQKAILFCQEAMDIALATGEDWTTIVIYDILGESYLGLQNVEEAMFCFKRGLALAIQIDAWDLVTRLMVNSAVAYQSQKNFDTAGRILFAALSHSSILFEFRQKGLQLLEALKIEPPQMMNDNLVLDILHQIYEL
jgi:tetratricopeptide (TPR) repeat protein